MNGFNRRIKIRIEKIVLYTVLAVFIAFCLFPLYVTFRMSLQSPKDVWKNTFFFLPTLDNYKAVLLGLSHVGKASYPAVANFPYYLLNSIIVSVSVASVSLLLALPMSFAMVRYKFSGKNSLLIYIFFIKMLPPLEESAMIDGCTRVGAFFRVVLPLAAPGIAATLIFNLILAWNEFLYALVLTGSHAKTAPVAICSFIYFQEVAWGCLCSAGMITVIPIVFLVIPIQKYLVRGLTSGAVTG
jgi:multiple sugar transport system permease protein